MTTTILISIIVALAAYSFVITILYSHLLNNYDNLVQTNGFLMGANDALHLEHDRHRALLEQKANELQKQLDKNYEQLRKETFSNASPPQSSVELELSHPHLG